MSKLLNDPNEMSFLDHLEDLRWHILRSFIAILICGSIAFIFKDFIFDKIIFGHKNVDFFTYEILCKIVLVLPDPAPALINVLSSSVSTALF